MSGYIGNIPVPQATQTRQSFTATASQTTFNTAGYSPGYIDVFLNGVKLAPADYTATNGSDVVLAVGAASGDILETVAYEIFQVLDQDFTGDFTVDGSTFVVDSTNDRVGIGTSSPAYKTEISDGTVTFGVNPLSAYSTAYVGTTTNHGMNFITNGNSRLNITSGGNVGIGTTSPNGLLEIDGTTNDSPSMFISHNGNASIGTVFGFHSGNDFRLWNYENGAVKFGTNNAEAMRIDDSGKVIIGNGVTADAGTLLTVGGAATFTGQNSAHGASRIKIGQDTTAISQIRFYGADTSTAGILQFTGSSSDGTGGSERMRIDSNGNLLVGTTSSFGSSGITLGSNVVYAAASSQNVANFQRYTTDGEIVRFGKDGTTVGSIGTQGSDLWLGTGDTGLYFQDGADAIIPWNTSTNTTRDNAIDLGSSTYRWNDLYLSGGVYLGGVGSANHLDDYEEGSWTPNLSGYTMGSNNFGWYVKIGRTCYVTATVDWTSGSGNPSYITGLPFAASTDSNGSYAANSISIMEVGGVVTNGSNDVFYGRVGASSSVTSIQLLQVDYSSGVHTGVVPTFSSSGVMRFSFAYSTS